MSIKTIVESAIFKNFIISLIILNGITMGFETSNSIYTNYQTFFDTFNTFVITIFTIEIILRIYVYRVNFFKDAWSLFDLFVVVISLIPSSGSFGVLRTLRVLRLFRIFSVVPQMRKIIEALLKVLPGIGSIAALMLLFFYICAIITTNLYGKDFPEFFGTLGDSLFTLFQIMTLESWAMNIVRPIMKIHPYSWIFFISFIFIATFIMINLIIAIVVDAINELKDEETKEINQNIKDIDKDLKSEIADLKKEILELKELLKK